MKSGVRSKCVLPAQVGLLLVTLLWTAQVVQAQIAEARKVIYECEMNHPDRSHPEYLEVTFAADGGSVNVSSSGQRNIVLMAQPSESGFYFLEAGGAKPDGYRAELRGTLQDVTYGTSRQRKVCKLPGQARTELFACNLNYKIEVQFAADRNSAALSINGATPITLPHNPILVRNGRPQIWGQARDYRNANLHLHGGFNLSNLTVLNDGKEQRIYCTNIRSGSNNRYAQPNASLTAAQPPNAAVAVKPNLAPEFTATQGPVATPEPAKATPKKPGVIRFGIVGAGGQSIPDAQVQAANAQLMQMLGGEADDDGFEAVLLQGKLDVMIRQEAKKKECDYIVFVKELNSNIGSAPSGGSNPFNALRDTAKKALEIAPNSALKSAQTNEAQTKVDKTADLLNSVAKTTKKKDKVGLKFNLVAVSKNTEIIADTLKEKVASKDGEDVLGSVLVEVGNLILNAVAKQ